MDRFDFSPLFRSTIGFDRLTRMLDAATRVDSASLGYPPYRAQNWIRSFSSGNLAAKAGEPAYPGSGHSV